MAASDLLQKIRADGRARVREIEARRDAELSRIAQALAEEARNLEREYHEASEKEAALFLGRARSRARLEQRNALLAARWKMIDRALGLAAEKLPEEKDYAELVLGLVKRYAGKDSVVRFSNRDSGRLKTDSGTNVGQPASIKGGVVIVQGRTVLDFSVDRALEAMRGRLAKELNGILFSSGPSGKV